MDYATVVSGLLEIHQFPPSSDARIIILVAQISLRQADQRRMQAGLPSPSLCENGQIEALEGRLNVIAPREVSRNGGIRICQPAWTPRGGETRYNYTGRSVTLYFAPGELIGALCIGPPFPLRCSGGYDIDSPLRG